MKEREEDCARGTEGMPPREDHPETNEMVQGRYGCPQRARTSFKQPPSGPQPLWGPQLPWRPLWPP